MVLLFYRQQLQNGDSSLKEGEGEEEDGALQNPFKPIQVRILSQPSQ